MSEIVIYGAGGHAKVIADIVESSGIHTIAGFLDDNKKPGTKFFGYEILGGIEQVGNISSGIVAIGDNWTRKVIVNKINIINPEFEFITAIHPNASIGRGVKIGRGTVIMAGAIVNSDASIGDFSIINTKSSVGHDSILGDFVTIAPNATLGGNVRVDECSTLSISSTVLHGKTIGKHTVIGAGSSVVKNVPSFVVSYGTPAKSIRSRNESDRYLWRGFST